MVVERRDDMAIKMRNNKDANSVCCECGEQRKDVLDMFDLCIGDTIFTICDACNEKVFNKCLRAECYKNGRVKSQHDIAITNRRKHKTRGTSFTRGS